MFKDPKFASRVPPHIKERYESVNATRVANMKLARRCGVPMAMGSDAGTPRPHCGDHMQEGEIMVDKAGFLAGRKRSHAATMGAADMMGLTANLGSLSEGKYADVIATAVDPLQDISALRNVGFVMKGGRVHKRDGAPLPFL